MPYTHVPGNKATKAFSLPPTVDDRQLMELFVMQYVRSESTILRYSQVHDFKPIWGFSHAKYSSRLRTQPQVMSRYARFLLAPRHLTSNASFLVP
jgi:hypothetical protein